MEFMLTGLRAGTDIGKTFCISNLVEICKTLPKDFLLLGGWFILCNNDLIADKHFGG